MRRFLAALYAALVLVGCRTGPGSGQPPVQTPTPAPAPLAPQETPKSTLPGPDEAAEEPAPPSDVPAPPGLSYREAISQILAVHPPGLRPLYAAGRVPVLLHDLDRDDSQDCLSVATSVQSQDEARRLADPQRLFQDDAPRVPFFLLVFPSRGGRLQQSQSIPLGEHLVFASMRGLPLSRGRTLPLIVTVTFSAREGDEIELFVFDGNTVLPRHHRGLVQSMSAQARLEDIDGDGTIDLLLRERGMEEGIGLESFLSWHRWNGRAFVEYRSTNVVRNLNAFLHTAGELMEGGQERALLAFAIEPAEISRLRRRGLKDSQILVQALGLRGSGLEQWPQVREVVLPDILEDPFSTDGTCRLTYRLVDPAGVPYIAAAQLRMLPNPFGERQFGFVAP